MDDRHRYEADIFTRYESRIVALEIGQQELRGILTRLVPIVEALRDNELVADAIADRLRATATLKLTKVHVGLAVFALFLPAIVGALLTVLLAKGHL